MCLVSLENERRIPSEVCMAEDEIQQDRHG